MNDQRVYVVGLTAEEQDILTAIVQALDKIANELYMLRGPRVP